MGDLLVDRPYLQRVHFLHLARDKHALHSDQVQLGRWEWVGLGLEVAVHEGETVEVCLVGELVRRGHFHHPVQHPRSQRAVDEMIAKEVIGLTIVVRHMQQILAIQLTIRNGVILYLRLLFTPHGHGLIGLLEVC